MYIPKSNYDEKNFNRTCANTGCLQNAEISSRWCAGCRDLPKDFGKCECGATATTHKKNLETGNIDVPCCSTCLKACFSNEPSMSERCGDSGGSMKYDDSDFGDEGYIDQD